MDYLSKKKKSTFKTTERKKQKQTNESDQSVIKDK